MRNCKEGSTFYLLFWIWVFLFVTVGTNSVKVRYASESDCDRYSLDAVYYERYKIVTENIFKDTIEFVNRVADSVADSLTTTMASMPDRQASSNEERKIYAQFKSIKSAYSNKVKKVQKNITAKWDDLVASHFDLMYDNGKCSLVEYLNKTLNMTDTYKAAKKTLDGSFGPFITFVKSIVRDGLHGIAFAADDALKKDEAKKNSTENEENMEEGKVENEEEEEEENEEKPEDKLLKKKLEIIEMVVSGFLGKVSKEVVKRNMDLFKKDTIKPEDRDSVLDDMLFDIIMIRNRMLAIVHEDIPNDKGSIDLARRSIYTYWADQADKMYKEKIKSKQTTSPGGDLFYKKLWSDDKVLMDTLLDLMEVYP